MQSSTSSNGQASRCLRREHSSSSEGSSRSIHHDQYELHISAGLRKDLQAQTLGGPAVPMQQHALQAFHPALRAGHHRFNAGLNDNDRSLSASTAPLIPEMRLTSSKRPRKPKAVAIRSADWEPYKKAILTLHLEQNMPLRKVQQMIEKEYGFKAEYDTSVRPTCSKPMA